MIVFWKSLATDASFGQFKKLCLMLLNRKNGNSVFDTMNVSQVILQESPFHLTFVGCCKKFVDFQIELFNATSFQLRSVNCEITREMEQEQQDVDFDYEEEFYLSDYDTDNDSSNDSSDV